jgi:beta-lactam-binding protein with PASTA domain
VSGSATNKKKLAGIVADQTPPGGTELDQGQAVTIVVYVYEKSTPPSHGGGGED